MANYIEKRKENRLLQKKIVNAPTARLNIITLRQSEVLTKLTIINILLPSNRLARTGG
jgi:hypothetical protein